MPGAGALYLISSVEGENWPVLPVADFICVPPVNGTTQSVSFGTNKGSVNMTGEEFKKAFNLRAPGYIGLKSSLFNIEKL